MHEFVVASCKKNKIKIRAFDNWECAHEYYEEIDHRHGKVLVDKVHGNSVHAHGEDHFVQRCMHAVHEIPTFLPVGSYRETSTHVEVKYDTKHREFKGRANCRTTSGDWRENEFEFHLGEAFNNIDGHMEKAHHHHHDHTTRTTKCRGTIRHCSTFNSERCLLNEWPIFPFQLSSSSCLRCEKGNATD